eukprot:TRINITY_DN120107_c0_g1_i1.p1 TRINITY_DN120107_c0_g1~~TRINITY_DN120107_c0_g1_i1.p1  ORF type:complete len:603 (+),score=40.66 TRINITY_DN120107_c0_g1_i1:115-1809(+)
MKSCFLIILVLAFGRFPLARCGEGLLCGLCHIVHDIASAFLHSDLYIYLARVQHMRKCEHRKDICERLFDRNDVVTSINYIKRFNATIVCSKLGMCKHPKIVVEDIEEYKRNLLSDKPPRQYPTPTNATAPLKFVLFTDPHIDPNYTDTKSIHCKSTMCCRDDSFDIQSDDDRPGKWGHIGMCELPYRTADHFVDTVWEKHPDASFMLWLGDNPANVYYAMTREDHRNIIGHVTNKLLVHHNKLGDVYPVIGNHEGLPRDHMEWDENGSNWLLEIIAELWAPWLTPDSRESLRKCGHYTQLHPGTNLRIIALNSLVRGSTNSYIWGNTTDVCGELSWLQRVLDYAEKHDEKALIIEHYPPNDWFSTIQWTLRYNVIVDRYANIIVGQMAGHTHEDSFQVIRSSRPGEIAGVAFENPSLTPSYFVLPSYRVYLMDPENYMLLDYEQYRFNMSKANREDKPEWYLSYKFKEYYGVDNMEDRTFNEIANKVRVDDETYKKYAEKLYADGPRSEYMKNNVQFKHMVYCWLSCADYYQSKECSGGYKFWDTFMLEHFLPPWEYAVQQPL